MTPEQWESVRELFHAALDLGEDDRSRYIQMRCHDALVRAEVESLLGALPDVSPVDAPVHRGARQAIEFAFAHSFHAAVPGDLVGHYEIRELIGSGGMGQVYQAHDRLLKRDVALKLLPGEFAADPERMARLQAEAEVLASLNHPNIAQIYGIEDGALVMELVPGKALSGRFPPAIAVEYGAQIGVALEYAHARGVVHRDLKPANIMVTGDGVVKILDFGLARVTRKPADSPVGNGSGFGTTTHPGGIAGTPGYMSPEQAMGQPLDKRTDVWSFGIVLWEMLTGERLFTGIADALEAPIRFGKLPRETPPAVRDLLARCLERDPERRLADIGEAKLILRKAAGNDSGPKRPLAFLSSRRVLWAGLFVVILTLAATVITRNERSTNHLSFQNRDWIIVAQFENETGEKQLDGTMEFAIQRELSQSSYVNVAPPERIRDDLTLMRESPDATLSENLARQVAMHDDGIKAVLTGTVQKFGVRYVIALRIFNPTTGNIATLDKAGTAAELPEIARTLSINLRRKLGEPDNRFPARPALERVTTPSLAALHIFSSAMGLVNQRKWSAAAVLLEEATREDPRFALAHIYAAHAYANINQNEQAASHFRAAFQLASGVSARERLFILGSYYSFLKEDRRAVAAYEALLQLYPDDFWGANNAAAAYARLGMRKEEMSAYERIVAARPAAAGPWDLALWWYYKRDEPDEARSRHWKSALLRSPLSSNPWARSLIDTEPVADQWRNGDVKGAAELLARVSAQAESRGPDRYKFFLSSANLVLGRAEAARVLCDHVTNRATQSECFLRVAYVRGNRDLANAQLLDLRKTGPTSDGRASDIIIATWYGETALAQRWISEGLEFMRPILMGHPEKAMAPVPRADGPEYTYLWYRLAAANVLERRGKLAEAIEMIGPEISPNAVSLLEGWTWPQCRLKLAELYRKQGRRHEAAEVESEVRRYLSQADCELPAIALLRSQR
ncbi:MAG TPA: protein kinase [Bryobacteraceae bacterium]|nr:protein kinase [Bryobacteraceae bacterium]